MAHPLNKEWTDLAQRTHIAIWRLIEIQREIKKDNAVDKAAKQIIEEIDLISAATIIQDAENCSMW
jgi:hypothetical protein